MAYGRSTRSIPFTPGYEGASAYLGAKDRRPLPGAATTLERRDDGSIAVRYHDTDVLTYHPDGTVTLTTGYFTSGYFPTRTTKRRINAYLPEPWHVEQKAFRWTVYGNGEAIPFSEGVRLG
jgi:hypothetical protein